MIALGVILVLLVLLVTIFAVVASGAISTGIALTGLGLTISISPLGMFLAGALSVILLGLGFALVSRGARRTAGKRKELKELRRAHAAPDTKTTDDRGDSRADGGSAPESGSNGKDPGAVHAKGPGTGDRSAEESRSQRADAPPQPRVE